MLIPIQCPCGETKMVPRWLVRRGQKYCSDACARRLRVYGKPDSPQDARVTVPLTQAQRDELQGEADRHDVRITDYARQCLLLGLRTKGPPEGP